jgi:hypothetical protein
MLQPVGATPNASAHIDDRDQMRAFLESFRQCLVAAPSKKGPILDAVERHFLELEEGRPPHEIVGDLSRHFAAAPWVAILVPCGDGCEVDQLLERRLTLTALVDDDEENPGFVMQFDRMPEETAELEAYFPAFAAASAARGQWPAILVWRPSGEEAFVPLSKELSVAHERMMTLMKRLGERPLSLAAISGID